MANLETPPNSMTFPSGRLAGLDALRGGAMLLGILLHAAMAYMPTRIPHMLWPVLDDQTTWVCDVVYWGAHTFRLPLFFFLSGFLTEQLFQARGARAFLDQRVRRLAIPYVASLGTVLPMVFVVWSLGWIIAGRCTLEEALHPLIPFEPELEANYFNPAHLWFLIDLMIFNAVYFFLRLEWPGAADTEHSCRIWRAGTWLTPLALTAPAAMLLWGSTSPVTEFHNSFLPHSGRLLYYGLYFSVGAMAYRTRESFVGAIQHSTAHLIGAVVAIGVSLMTLEPVITGTAGLWTRCAFAWSVTSAAWFSIFGLMGAVIRHQADSPRLRYLADSSYWMFLIHFPVVGLAHIALRPLTWVPELKMLVAFGITVLLGFGSYFAFVRHTIIGHYLHGRRDRSTSVPASLDAVSTGVRRAA